METIKNAYLAFRIIKKKLFLNIILMLQVLFCMMLMFTFVTRIQYQVNYNGIINGLNVKNAYYLCLFDQFEDVPDATGTRQAAVAKKLGGVADITGIGSVKQMACAYKGQNRNGELTAYVYNRSLINAMRLPLQSGVWFSDYANKDGLVPVIVSAELGLKVSDTLSLTLSTFERNETEYSRKGIVAGVINPLDYLFTFTSGGTDMGLDKLVSKESHALIVPEYAFDPNEHLATASTTGRLIIASQKADILEKEITDLGIGNITDLDKMRDVSAKDYGRFLLSNGLVLLVFTLLTLAGIGGGNGLQRIANEKNFSVYYIAGSDWRHCVGIEIWRTAILIGTPAALFMLVYAVHGLDRFYQSDFALINVFTFVFIYLYTLALYVLTSLGPILSLMRCNPVEVIKRWE